MTAGAPREARPSVQGPLTGVPLLEDLPDLDGRRVLVRVDFNVPLRSGSEGADGVPTIEVADDFRIVAALPTITWLQEHGAEVTVCTHLGRPKGAPDPRFAVEPVRRRLAEVAPGVAIMENLRFDPGETGNDPDFVARLVDGYDAYVDDAFGACHRAHASVVGPPTVLPSAAGRLLQRELEVLGSLLTGPARPFVAVVGGAKVADKLGVLEALLDRVDRLVVGGGMAFTFLAALGRRVGASLLDEDRVAPCRALVEAAGDRLLLPEDIVALGPGGTIGEGGRGEGEVAVVSGEVPDGWRGLDIGPATAERYAEAVACAGTVFWNGPMGVFEDERFAAGTRQVAEAVAGAAGLTVVGGGDSVAAIDQLGLADRVDFVSTGGGASLELLEHGDLPGLVALRQASNAPAPSRPAEGGRASRRASASRGEGGGRRMLVSGNWKMHHDHLQAIRTVQDLGLRIEAGDVAALDVSVHPPFTDLRSVQTVVEDRDLPLLVGAQHCHSDDQGAFTGEVAAPMLARLGVSYVIAGHSERRQLFGETDEMVAARLRAVLRHGMVPILCVGESGEERERDETQERLTTQVSAALEGLAEAEVGGIVVAYEPIWAIGTGVTATAEDAQEACAHIRSVVRSVSGDGAATSVRIQYGGSVKPGNAAELVRQPDVDGLLVGGASLEAASFAAIVHAAAGVAVARG